ncbi:MULTISPECIES: hypothetical protein [unclassified Microbacterium]|uniref:hypothetical protein n=1 Tax=unclassified Microbacterium TaxID=2609290 RepID=UPI000CFD27DA|nr:MULTISPECIES: hypothetical protein [unclassified Microbacterium]PQZ50949.1 hypothetical protein CQ032_18530 [Microbacterium sp. MYb43]PQZ69694.1 hypothetical protein CQ031_19970 [Microbacterium sp. MYb40]PRB16425.1 hypothetical protein CQ040_18320 [Microbacterium sp. MYb54]PRB31408.1 hypothetical protein CQ037_01630 [Microbacterium sp. MYb50]PRB67690.1 hypothetical protein CQ027_18170 [Microbacterium sp. MYb32]
MEFSGHLPPDAPDPSIESEARVRSLRFPVFELRPQRTLTRVPIAGFMESTGAAGLEEVSTSFSYTLWRYPDDHADPRNEVELDEATRRSLEEEPPWERPAWLIEQVKMFRYPMLWEAIRTSWHASPDPERSSLSEQLVAHTNHILRNQFREELCLSPDPRFDADEAWEATTTAVSHASLDVDGEDHPALQIDTDPFVYSIGFRVDEQVVCTMVIPRDALPVVDLAVTCFAPRPQTPARTDSSDG